MALCMSCNDCGRCKNIYKQIIKCPKCNTTNRKDKKICKKCGAVLQPDRVWDNSGQSSKCEPGTAPPLAEAKAAGTNG